MNVGDRFSSPWGDYVVLRTEPELVLKQGCGAIVAPSAATLARMGLVGSGRLSVTVDPSNEPEPSVVPPHAISAAPFMVANPLVGESDFPTTVASVDEGEGDRPVYEMTLGAHRSLMSMCIVTGCELVWVPCLTRSEVPGHELKPHAYLLTTANGTMLCDACRPAAYAKRPRLHYKRDGVVVFDTHAISSSCSLGFRDELAGVQFRAPDLSSPAGALMPLCAAGEADGQSRSSDLSPTDGLSSHSTRSDPAQSSSASELLAIADAHESTTPEVTPPRVDAREGSAAPAAIARPFHADDPKASTGSFERWSNPIGRAWLGLWEWKEWCAERAGIVEFDGNMTRALAEKMARSMAGPAPRHA